MPTMSITSAWSITASANPPRAVFTDFPLGHTAGPPDDPHCQLAITRAALEAVETIATPGTIRALPFEWGTDWKEAARTEGDIRTPRHDTPQYQSEDDRQAAVAAHGEAVACTVCAPDAVPVS